MDNSVIIRQFEAKDTERVIALWHACELVKPWNDPDKDIAIKLAHDGELFLVAEQNGVVVASVMGGYEGHRGWANYLVVDPEIQGAGLGRLMMDELELRLKDKGCPKINLQVRATNQKVIEFYQALGFQIDNSVSLGKRLDGVKYQA
ncbi:GNAT family acetyltransferase [Vibrio sp. SCSIO 43136]|uniref:GNAT family acetyltransferase n=1 Tax=Vibrio sp. SCSIO 43136 TaxID=2819101 RepID=UPI0020753C29|nr:GNAT family acetyltransferase [Vibrio sp. SCSIO 43136]USD67983.1 GNAT family acetyltransferase [Vibrio sp. SCSIO 43136]